MGAARKIRLTEPGFEKLTGPFGVIDFVDGVSVDEVSEVEASRIANCVRTEFADDGKNPSDSQRVLDSQHTPMDAEMMHFVVPTQTAIKHTREELEALADKEGIVALRAIGDKFGVKGAAIAKLINSIMSAQAGLPEGEAPVEPVAPQEVAAPRQDEIALEGTIHVALPFGPKE